MGVDGIQPQPAVQDRPAQDRLDSWKEIAAYLKKEVRTVQRWEKNFGLPVRRLAHGKLGTVFAYKQDLDAWWRESQSKADAEGDKSDSEEETDSSSPNVVVLDPKPDQPEKTANDQPRPDRVRRIALFAVLFVLGVALLRVALPWILEPFLAPKPKMILAVRPFKNLSGDPGQDFVADGVTEEMITRLGQLHPVEMGVIRLSSAYASSGLDRIGKDVRANYVLEGGVRHFGGKVSVTAQLIQVSDQTEVWGESYERDLQDVLSIQSEVAGA